MNMHNKCELMEYILADDNLPPFSEKQWDALCGDIEMTQEIYNEILDLCCEYSNFAEYYETRQSFPELNAEHNKHFAKKYGFVSKGKFDDIIEFEQFNFVLDKSLQELGFKSDDSHIMEFIDNMC